MLNPRLFIHLLCSSTSDLHLVAPSSPSSWPYLRKHSSLFPLVSGQAQQGLMPVGLSAVTCLLEVSGALAGEDCVVVEASAEVLGVADGDESLLLLLLPPPLLLSGALDHGERWRERQRGLVA